MMAVMACPCCGEVLSSDRRLLLHLASIPMPRDQYDAAAEGRTPQGIIAATGIAHCTVYSALQRLQMSGLVTPADYKFRSRSRSGKGLAHVYVLTEEGRELAERLRGAP